MNTRNQREQARKDPAERRYFSARICLLLAVLITALNLAFALSGGSLFIFFSLSIPYYIVLFFSPVIALAVGGAVMLFFLLCCCFSGKHVGWMTAALIGFCADTVFFAAAAWLISSRGILPPTQFIFEAAAHVWILVTLILGTVSAKKVRTLHKEKENLLPDSAFFTRKGKK